MTQSHHHCLRMHATTPCWAGSHSLASRTDAVLGRIWCVQGDVLRTTLLGLVVTPLRLAPPPQSAVADTVCEAVFELVQHFVDVGANTSADPVATIQAAHDERLSWWRAQDVSDVYVGTGMGYAWPSHPNITLCNRTEAEAVKRVETGFAHLERLGCMFKSAAALAATSSGGSLTAQDRDRRKTQEKLGRLVHVVYRHLGSRLDMLEAFLRKKRFKFVSVPSPPTLAVPRAD